MKWAIIQCAQMDWRVGRSGIFRNKIDASKIFSYLIWSICIVRKSVSSPLYTPLLFILRGKGKCSKYQPWPNARGGGGRFSSLDYILLLRENFLICTFSSSVDTPLDYYYNLRWTLLWSNPSSSVNTPLVYLILLHETLPSKYFLILMSTKKVAILIILWLNYDDMLGLWAWPPGYPHGNFFIFWDRD